MQGKRQVEGEISGIIFAIVNHSVDVFVVNFSALRPNPAIESDFFFCKEIWKKCVGVLGFHNIMRLLYDR